jgi:acyl-CoA synthetase (NDP forming)
MPTLSEHESKVLLTRFGIGGARETLVAAPGDAAGAAARLGFPVALKLCGAAIAHKTERGLVRLGLADAAAVARAADELWALRRPEDGATGLLVAEMVRGRRELIAGVVRDPQFGPCVMLGVGGIFAEALGDVVFAVAPLGRSEALRMIAGLRTQALLGPFRGEPAVDRDALAAVLCGLGRLAVERADVASVDVNPLIVRDGVPVAVDALVELGAPASLAARELPADEALRGRFRPLFHPRGVVVAGASSHPGKFGFAAFHNLLRFGYRGRLFPVNRDGAEVLGHATLRDVTEVPEGAADLVVVCTPAAGNAALLQACAARGIGAAFVASGGYAESDDTGAAAERELVRVADAAGVLLAGPNGQGLVSTADALCAQIVAPYPPPGGISIASQSGNLLSSLLNYANLTGIGVSKAISAGNAAQTTIADYLAYFAADSDTTVALAYVEGVRDGHAFVDAVRRTTARKPLVLLKGGVSASGQRAAASHTGALASDDRVFDGVCRQTGALRAPSVEEAFEWAATLATQPLPHGRRVAVVTTVGGWGVLTADAIAAADLELVALPDELRAAIDPLVPSRWSRGNPIDLAGGETRDTIPAVLDLVARHSAVDAIIFLGLGVQANQAHVLRSGPFFPGHGLDRIVEFHERQDRRYAEAARDVSERHAKPVLVATELVYADRWYGDGNPGPTAVRAGGRLCYPSGHRAVSALAALVAYAGYRRSLD